MKAALQFLLLLLAFATPAAAHEARPAYLELRQTGADTYDVLWKVPGRGDKLRLGLYVELPDDAVNLEEPRERLADGVYTARWSIKRPGGLVGGRIAIKGLSSTLTDVLVREERLDGTTQVTRVEPSAPSFVVQASPDRYDIAHTYTVLGIGHILGGVDHLLFVLALVLIVGHRWTMLLETITSFTIAHSITLALAALGFVYVPQAPVEAVIALSIVFVASEILHQRAGRPGLTARYPWIVAFVFGLLHGFGFAGALNEVGLPQNEIPLALFLFNVGVEIGQLLFVAVAIAVIAIIQRVPVRWPGWMPKLPPYAIGGLATFWLIQRISLF